MPSMKRVIFLLCLLTSLSAFSDEKPNVLLICVDDLRPELGCYGVEHISSPHIDRLASRGRIFRRHYVQAPTCGASRFTLLTGSYGGANNMALFARSTVMKSAPEKITPSMPAWFRQHGYTTVSVGKVSHHPGGRGGGDWNDPLIPELPKSWDIHEVAYERWQHPRGWMHGLANGEIRVKAGEMDVFQAKDGPDSIYPDGPNIELALKRLQELANASDKKPFFLACGILRPHLPFGAPKKYYDLYRDVELPKIPHPEKPEGKTTWHGSGEFMKYNRWGKDPNTDSEFADEVRRHYAACVSYADEQVGRILARLDQLKLRENTIIVLWGDHGWHLGERAVWGKHTLFEESLRAPLIISYTGLEQPGQGTASIVETLDIFPTLVDLAGLPAVDFVDGESLRPFLKDPATKNNGEAAFSYKKGIRTIRTDTHRLIAHARGGFLELYDERTGAGETENIASSDPGLAAELLKKLNARLEE